MRQYEMFELAFNAPKPDGSQTQIDLSAEFTWGENCKIVKGFYAGSGVYKIRFLPEEPGEYTWRISGGVKAKGGAYCGPAMGAHGIVRTSGTHFTYADGTIFRPVGTTIYALAHQTPALIEQTLATLQNAPFNKVRQCVFPKHYDYNHNEPEFFPFELDANGDWDVHRPCFPFWDRLETILFQLAELGIQTDLILFHPYDRWGFSELSREQCLVYLDYLLRRFTAIPELWWSMANEFDLITARTTEDWYAFEAFITENDPWHHLLSNHNCFSFYDFTRPAISHCCVQTTQVESAGQWIKKYHKPLIYDECCYEGDLPQPWGNISGFEMVNRFWIAGVQGAYATHGETFLSEDEVLWWAKGGILKGKSPSRIAYFKAFLDSIPGPLEPWEIDLLEGMEPATIEQFSRSPFVTLPQLMPAWQQNSTFIKETNFRGHYGNAVFLQYMGRHCAGLLQWTLPEDRTYLLDVIDVWEMTRKTVLTGVSGKVTIRLPGKEGIAVVAIEEATAMGMMQLL